MAKPAPNPSRGEQARKAAFEATQASAVPRAPAGSGPAPVWMRAGESQNACRGTQGRRHLLGPRTKRAVGLSGAPNLPGGLPRLVTRLYSGSHEAPPHPFSPSRLDPRAKAQVAVTAVSRGSLLPHPAVPRLWAPRPSPADVAITLRCPGTSSVLGSPHVPLRGLLGRLGVILNKFSCSNARAHTHTLELSAIERDNDPERCKFTWYPPSDKAPSPHTTLEQALDA